MRYFQKIFIVYCTVFALVLLFPAQARADVIFQDTFNRDNLTDWTVARNFQWGNPAQPCLNNGQLASWQILLQRLGIIIYGPGCFTEIVANAFALPTNTSYAYSFDITMPESANMDRNYTMRFVDTSNNLAIKILGNAIFLEKAALSQGWSVPGSFAHYPFQADHTYHIRNEVRIDHSIKVYIDGELVLNFLDTPPYLDGGTVGFRASVGSIPNSITWFDNVVVETIDVISPLNVPYLSQLDPRWMSTTYDSAKTWSTVPTIGRWGCVLTDAVMILQYHNITTLPNGLPIDPQTLNDWLLSQPDGYLGQGYVNWVALTRVAHLFHTTHVDTPSLEYLRGNADMNILKEEIDKKRPMILDLGGHFVVGRGATQNNAGLIINDPFDQVKSTVLAQNIRGSRLFRPSFTDLSYIVIPMNADLETIVERDGQQILPVIEGPITPDGEDETMPNPLSLIEIPKPTDGQYTLRIKNNSSSQVTQSIFSYNTTGDLLPLSIDIQKRSAEQVFVLDYT
ncbi:MAG: C39 family peptidase, partial [Patescibacteria group bacterium]